MSLFKSNEEFFQAVGKLIMDLEVSGHLEASAELKEGFACLNGLTDGYGLFLESIERVQAVRSGGFDRDQKRVLDTIQAAVRAAIYRR